MENGQECGTVELIGWWKNVGGFSVRWLLMLLFQLMGALLFWNLPSIWMYKHLI